MLQLNVILGFIKIKLFGFIHCFPFKKKLKLGYILNIMSAILITFHEIYFHKSLTCFSFAADIHFKFEICSAYQVMFI